MVNVAATNQNLSGNPYTLVGQLFTNLNNTASLQGLDGVSAEDYVQTLFGAGQFNLFARTNGLAATGIQITLSGSGTMIYTPSATSKLDDNIGDVQPRNHVYLRAGTTNLTVNFPLITTALADGYHDLTAVAYEGSSVRTQTRTTLPVRVQNSSLSATVTLLDLAATNSVQGTYHIQVTANTNNVSSISLFSTGGTLSTAPNQSSATFTVNGPALGVGLHQFYSIVQTASGLSYRTQPQWVRLVAGP
jgi:hypothetical protein